MKVTLAQLNPTVGDIEGNTQKLLETLREYSGKTELIVFSELFLTGYPPKDLLGRKSFIDDCENAIEEIKDESRKHPDTGVLFGAPVRTGEDAGRSLYNTAILICDEKIIGQANKSITPTYDVFDEARYFKGCSEIDLIEFKGEKIGVSICADAWSRIKVGESPVEDFDPVGIQAEQGATLFVNLSASPFCQGKDETRYDMVKHHARSHGIPFIYVNQVGGNDELVFDGQSMAVDGEGRPLAVLSSFKEETLSLESGDEWMGIVFTPQDRVASVHDALVFGLSEYMEKCRFEKAVVGLSGGIDSAVTAVIAVEALGKQNVLGVSMPSEYSSKESISDAMVLGGNLGIKVLEIPIQDIYQQYLETLESQLKPESEIDKTCENIQARIRGNILMAISNKHGHLVLSTGNKSELAVGYCTLYGDMSGGLAVLSDVPKTMVYEIAGYLNIESERIPIEIIRKEPSAELRPDQLDSDTLPPYDELDGILALYVEEGASIEDIAGKGFDEGTVRWVAAAVNRNEYKRRQAPLGVRVTSKAFGSGRRMPIAAKYE